MDAMNDEKEAYPIDSEKLAYWYFRLNGFLTIENFVVHPDWGTQQCTDIDLLAARFPHRAELLEVPMEDDKRLTLDPHRIRIILSEVKASSCDLNETWTNPDKKNIQRMLRAVGTIDRKSVDDVSEKIYNHGWYEDQNFLISLCCLGQQENQNCREQFPEVPQLTWKEVLSFIHKRFRMYQKQKCSHDQWDPIGKKLWKYSETFEEFNEFRKAIKIVSKSSHSPDE